MRAKRHRLEWLTTKAIAEQMGVTQRAVRHWVASYDLPAVNVSGRFHRIRITDFEEFLERWKVRPR